ncbi:serine hydrolase [Luteitalea sp. TBR-22]|uniref:serine hydrolase domain-containing protein n=1 Tax=Luteitalea sp. TBR-22 TaxID=2802971 RepID=UPI001AF43CCF|nr:serine hydrolase domain-containing protein [Luteitalea sp. TBR-22]BCS30951.1 serine hydrolase [Luteitalea sp. TBR-22]
MARPWKRLETVLALIALAVGAVIAFVFGLHVYVTSTAETLHPDARRIPSTAAAAPASEWVSAAQRAQAAVRARIVSQNLPGVSVAVGTGRHVVWAEGFGWADLETRAVVSPDTRFRIGTASIPLTSAAAGLLIDRGSLTLDAPIQVYVPEYPKTTSPVTLRQVMGHVAGLRTDSGDEGPLFGQHCERPADALAHIGDPSPRVAPGSAYRYSRYGFILVSAAIETAAAQPFLRFMRDRVFEPLGMESTRPDPGDEHGAGQAVSYFPRYSADPRYGVDSMRSLDYSCYAGSSVFVSTPTDLVRFGLAINDGTLLKPETVTLLQTPLRLADGKDTGYGLGWDVETYTLGGAPVQVVGHDGDLLGGIVSTLLVWRERGLVVAVVSNTSYADTPAIARDVAEAFVR